MLWRDHKRMAVAMARAFGLEEYEDALVKGSVEPDEKRTLVHTWPKAKRTSRRYLYRARKAFLKGKKKKCARLLGIVSHFIADGMVHETIDTYHRAKEHSRIEDELGDLAEIKALPMIDPAREGLADGEFVFAEIDALVRDGLDSEKLARALSLLGSAVLAPAQPPPDLIESRRDFIRKINKIDFRIMARGRRGRRRGRLFDFRGSGLGSSPRLPAPVIRETGHFPSPFPVRLDNGSGRPGTGSPSIQLGADPSGRTPGRGLDFPLFGARPQPSQ